MLQTVLLADGLHPVKSPVVKLMAARFCRVTGVWLLLEAGGRAAVNAPPT
jgi:hypothetical protein